MKKNKQLTDSTRTPLRHVFILLASLLFLPQIGCAQSAKAFFAREQVWDNENKKFKNKYAEDNNYTLYFVFDQINYDNNSGGSNLEDPDKRGNGYYVITWTDEQDEVHTDTIRILYGTWGSCQDFNSHRTPFKNFLNVTGFGNQRYSAASSGNHPDNRSPWRGAQYTVTVNGKDTYTDPMETTRRIVFADSFSGCSSKTYSWWFPGGCDVFFNTKLARVDGGRNLKPNIPNCTSLASLFYNNKALVTIDDVSTWLENGNKITNIFGMFNNCQKLLTLNLSDWYTTNITKMDSAFVNCKSLDGLDVNTKEVTKDGITYTAWDVSKTTSMPGLFKGCSSLTSLNLNKWNPAALTDVNLMFNGCAKLENVDMSNWRLPVLTSVTKMFQNLKSLKSVNLSNWNAEKLANATYMLSGCTSLENINFGDEWITPALKNVSYMFNGCTSLGNVNISNWSTPVLTNTSYMFNGCTSLENVNFGDEWITPELTDVSFMFQNCSSMKNVDLSSWSAAKLTTISSLFKGCSSLENVDLSNWSVPVLKSVTKMFQNFTSLKSIDLSNWSAEILANTTYMFNGCTSLVNINFGDKWITPALADASYMFQNCSSIKDIDLSNWSAAKLTTISSLFSGCSSLENVNMSNWSVPILPSATKMFRNITSLKSIDLSNWSTGKLTTTSYMFDGCTSLENANLSNCSIPVLTNTSYMFQNCSSLASIDLSGWDPVKVTTTERMFSGCVKLSEIHFGETGIDFGAATNMKRMFLDCKSIKSFNLDSLKTSAVTRTDSMFMNCEKLKDLQFGDNFMTSNATCMRSMFRSCKSLERLFFNDNFNTAKVSNMQCMFQECSGLKGVTFGKNFTMNKITYNTTTKVFTGATSMFFGCDSLRYIDFYNSTYSTSGSGKTFPLNSVSRVQNTSNNTFNGVPITTVIYLPKMNNKVQKVTNVVYSTSENEKDLYCPYYYSEDKVDIELPRQFNANEAVYVRTMPAGSTIGTAILPYAFASNDSIAAYVFARENRESVYFESLDLVPANTPFVFKVKKARTDGTAHFHMGDKSAADFNVTVYPTIGYSEEGKAKIDTDYFSTDYSYNGWTARGYYVQQMVDHTGAFYISRDGTKFCQADPQYQLLMYPHRITFHGSYAYGSSDAKMLDVKFMDLPTAIEEAEIRETVSKSQTIYDMQGRQQKGLQKGVNIVRMSDGTVRKVIGNK